MFGFFGNRMLVVNVILLWLTIPLMGQSGKSVDNTSDTVVNDNITIGIVEPYVIYDILAIKNIIVNALKDELENKYNYLIIENDSTLETKGDYQFIDFNMLMNRSQQSDFLLISKHMTVQTDHISMSYPNERTFDSVIKMTLYDKKGKLRAQSEYDFIPGAQFRTTKSGLKSTEKASKAAAKSIVKKIDELTMSSD
ncbi:MAG: hypothetical protein PVF73_03915 [Bacteroidales bacterium]|jgi:hypothetical protein